MKVLQLTNTNIPAVVVDANMPLGITTVKYPLESCGCNELFTIASSNADTVMVNRGGIYRVDYSASVVATDAGIVTLSIIVNGTSRYTVSATSTAAGTVNLTLPIEIYLPCNCPSTPNNIPAYIQIKNTGVALTSGTSNLIITKC